MKRPFIATSWSEREYATLPLISRISIQTYASALEGLARVLPQGLWHVKGSTALLAYVGPTARLPRDLDVAVAAPVAASLLCRASSLEDGHGRFIDVLDYEPIRFSDTRRKPQVYRVLLRVGRAPVAALITVGLLVVSEIDAMTDDRVTPIRYPKSTTSVPAATFSRCLAQKLLRYTRQRSGNRINTRWSDLWDFLVAASSSAASELDASTLRDDVEIEFSRMGRKVPVVLPEPPAEWLDHWDAHSFESRLSFGPLDAAAIRLARFWDPVLSYQGGALHWDPDSWQWSGTWKSKSSH